MKEPNEASTNNNAVKIFANTKRKHSEMDLIKPQIKKHLEPTSSPDNNDDSFE